MDNQGDQKKDPRLASEARRIRKEKTGSGRSSNPEYGVVSPVRISWWKRIVFLGFSLAAIGAALLLLAFPGTRSTVTSELAELFVPEPESRFYRLPAPPPKDPVVREQVQGPSEAEDEDQILYSGSQAPERIEPDQEEEGMTYLLKSPGSREAFALLEKDEGRLGSLIRGESEDLEFRSWDLVNQNPPEYLLDIVVGSPGDEEEQHLVFRVNLSSGAIEPMSQAARDFERQ